jgi:ABC-type multidrug transport system ATPase subunit
VGQAAAIASAPDVVIRAEGFGKRYGRRPAVHDLDIEVKQGEIYGLIGPDGAGKSSFMKAAAGVLSFDSGRLEVFGQTMDSECSAEKVKARLGFMPQGLGLNLYRELSVEENINFFARLRLVPEKDLAARKNKLLAMTRLDHFRDRAIKNLSGGMKQKLGLVCTLIHEPELIILDEPTTGVDPVSRRDFWGILAELLRESGISALISTAYMDEATRFHRVSLLFEGRVLAQGAPEDLVRQVQGTIVLLRATPQAEALARLHQQDMQAEAYGSSIRVFVPGDSREEAQQRMVRQLDGLHPSELHAIDPELEDAFLALLGAAATQEKKPQNAAPLRPVARPSSSEPAIEAVDLVRDFGDFRAVDHTSFRVMPGEVFGLLGANGAGKTTIIKMLTGILKPSGGNGRVGGVDMRQAGRAIKQRIGYMSQAFSLYQDLTVRENIRLYAGIYGLTRAESKERMRWILEMAGLAGYEDDQSGSLPMGLRQRLALGCALVHRPKILFLDEPTSGVDPIGRHRFWEILFDLARNEGVAILVTTHYMSESEHCDRLALMYAGRIVSDGSPAEMKQVVEAEAGRMLEVSCDNAAGAMRTLLGHGFSETALFGNRLHVLTRQIEPDQVRIRQLLSSAGIGVKSCVALPLSMEDVFVYKITSLEQQEERRKPAETQ